MGILFDDLYWGSVIGKLAELEPRPGQVFTRESANSVLAISCTALTNLVSDPEFDTDFSKLKSSTDLSKSPPPTEQFLSQFERLERKVLTGAGVSDEVTTTILADIVSARKGGFELYDFERFDEITKSLQMNVCKNVDSSDYLQLPRPTVAQHVKEGVLGIGVAAIDAKAIIASGGVSEIVGVTASALLSDSIKYGYSKTFGVVARKLQWW